MFTNSGRARLERRLSAVIVPMVLAASLCGTVGVAVADSPAALGCAPLDAIASASRTLDVNDPADAKAREIVTSNHFNSDVRTLQKGQTSTVPGDLDFVLRHIPNHYEALALMGRWQIQHKGQRQAMGSAEPAVCYFERAIAFRPEDSQLHAVYGVYLHQAGRLSDAEREYASAEAQGASDAEFYYNYGLLMFAKGDYSRASQYADKAYALGYPLPGLRNKLRGKTTH